MRAPRSLQARLALAVGLSVTVLWLAAASMTASRLGHEMEEVFDKDLEATAQRILPLALHDLRLRDCIQMLATLLSLCKALILLPTY